MEKTRIISSNSKDKHIYAQNIVQMKKAIEQLAKECAQIKITLKKSKVKNEEHVAKIVGIYENFFTVENEKLKMSFSIQYIDVITGQVAICKN